MLATPTNNQKLAALASIPCPALMVSETTLLHQPWPQPWPPLPITLMAMSQMVPLARPAAPDPLLERLPAKAVVKEEKALEIVFSVENARDA